MLEEIGDVRVDRDRARFAQHLFGEAAGEEADRQFSILHFLFGDP